MQKILAISSLFFLSLSSQADEQSMNTVLETWQQQTESFQESLDAASSPIEKQEVMQLAPNPSSIAKKLWASISARCGSREIIAPLSQRERRRGLQTKSRRVHTFEYEEPWAAPAVIWFIQHPEQLRACLHPTRVSAMGKALISATERVHFRSPHIADACAQIASENSLNGYKLLEKIYLNNNDLTCAACAALGMSIMLQQEEISAIEGSKQIANAKSLYYLKRSLQIAPKNSLFGNTSLDRVALEQIYLLSKLSIGALPPQIQISDQAGSKHLVPSSTQPYLLFFWSPQEEVGQRIIQQIDALLLQHPKLAVYPICTGMSLDELAQLQQEMAIKQPLYLDETGAGGLAYRIKQLPYAALISHRGRLLYLGYPDMKLQVALANYKKETQLDQRAVAPKAATPPAPLPAPALPEIEASSETAPKLRDMPKF